MSESTADEPVVAVRLLRVPPDQFDRIFGKIASFMATVKNQHEGCIATALLSGENREHMMIVSKYASHGAWVAAQWDARLAELHEEAALNSEMLHFELYREHNFEKVGL